jgi:hypothetical protein
MCDCMEEINGLLAPSNGRLEALVNLHDGAVYPFIRCEKIDPKMRGKTPVVQPTYCPFCGIAYKPIDVTDTPRPEVGSLWRHKNGNLYVVEDITNQESERQGEYPTTVVYRNVLNGKPYSRALWRWPLSMTPVDNSPPQIEAESR